MKNDRATYLVLGNSTAAVGAVEALRRVDRETPIVLVAREPAHTYSRPLISHLLAGEVDEARMDYRARDFYGRNGVDARLGVEALQIDTDARTVRVADARTGSAAGTIGFETLLIATGGRPVLPPFEGRNAAGVFTFTGWDDANAVAAWLEKRPAAKAVVIGGGLIGIKAAEALHARGARVLVVELADRLLPLALDRPASMLAEKALRAAGVELACGTTVARIQARNGAVAGVTLRDGREVPCDLAIVAIGVAPDLRLVEGTGIRTDRGLLVDARCETSVAGIYAAGDVAQGADMLSGQSRPLPIFPNAYRQGAVAGTNMAGGTAVITDAFPMNAVSVFGLPTISVGLAAAEGEGFEVLTLVDDRAGAYKRIVLRENRLVGALFVGDVDRAGILTGLIRERIDVSAFKHLLLTDRFGLITLPEGYRKTLVRGEAIEI